MNWSNLKKHLCAKCGAELKSLGMLADKYMCSNKVCDFSISAAKYDKIVATERRKETIAYDPDENLSALNNL